MRPTTQPNGRTDFAVAILATLSVGCQADRVATYSQGPEGHDPGPIATIQTACTSRLPLPTISLAVGQTARLTGKSCFQLPAFPASQYVLAYADPRLADQAQTMAEWPWPDSVQVEVQDLTAPPSPAPRAPVRSLTPGLAWSDGNHSARPVAFAIPSFCSNPAIVGNPWCRASPWTVGELFTLRPNDGVRPPQPAKVLRIAGRLVVAIVQADAGQLSSLGLARLDTALTFIQQRVLPFLGRIYAVPHPVTTPESGQLLLILEAQTSGNFAKFFQDPPDRGRYSYLSLRLGPGTAWTDPIQNANSLVEIISHELTHGFQQRWRYAHGPWSNYLGTLWAVEGSATFVQQHMAREFAGVGFLADFQQPQVDPDNKLWNLMTMAYPVKNLTAGYLQASSFLRDLVQRLVTGQGLVFDLAASQVLVGALEGWYGVNEDHQSIGLGLNARMQTTLNSSWSPRDALLDWTMSQVADQATTNQKYQNRTISLNGNLFGNTILPHLKIAAGSGGSLAILRGPGTTGAVVLEDNGVGGTFSIGGTIFHPRPIPTNQLEWLLLRVK